MGKNKKKKSLSTKTLEKKLAKLSKLLEQEASEDDRLLSEVEQKVDEIEAKDEDFEKELVHEEEKIEKEEERIEDAEQKIDEEAQKIKELEVEIEQRVLKEEEEIRKVLESDEKEDRDLLKIRKKLDEEEKSIERIATIVDPYISEFTPADFAQVVVGAIIGIIIQFSFVDASTYAKTLGIEHVSAILGFNYLLGYLLIYKSGIKKMSVSYWFGVIPKRLAIVYTMSLLVTALVLLIFGAMQIGVDTLWDMIRMTVLVSMAALFGAATLDLLK